MGVAQRHLGSIYAKALKMSEAMKALVIYGAEHLNEISCTEPKFGWRLVDETPQETGPGSCRLQEFMS